MMPPRVLASGPKPCGGNDIDRVVMLDPVWFLVFTIPEKYSLRYKDEIAVLTT